MLLSPFCYLAGLREGNTASFRLYPLFFCLVVIPESISVSIVGVSSRSDESMMMRLALVAQTGG